MIEPLRQSRVVPISDPLPAAWLRRAPTQPDADGAPGRLLRVSPAGQLRRALLETIQQANEVVLLASFLLSDEALAAALLKAAEQGKRVYVLTASDERLSKLLPDEDDSDPRMVEEHKRLLNQLADKVLLRSAEHFHAKLLVADPHTAPRGWLSTANFNKALLESVELGVRLEGEAAQAVAGWFSYAFWAEAERELSGKGRLAKVGPAPGSPAVPPGGAVEATTSKHNSLRARVLQLIDGARSELVVSCFGFDARHPVMEAIAAKARSGTKVTVLTRPRPAVREAALALEKAGARVLAHDKLHAKAILSDAGALVMSANLEPRGLDSGFELGVALDGQDREELRRILGDWQERFPWRFSGSTRRADHLGEICRADMGLSDGRRHVIEEQLVKLDPVTAADALQLEQTSEPKLRILEMKDFSQRVRFEWEVRPPRLPKGASEKLREVEREEIDKNGKPRKVKARVPHDPPVFEHQGQTFVILRDGGSVDRARQVAAELGARVVLP